MLRKSEEPFKSRERGQNSHISFEQPKSKSKLIISPREKKEHLGRLSKFMNHIKAKKQPFSLRSMKKSLAKLKQRPRTSGTELTLLPKVRSTDFPKAPDSVRLKQSKYRNHNQRMELIQMGAMGLPPLDHRLLQHLIHLLPRKRSQKSIELL